MYIYIYIYIYIHIINILLVLVLVLVLLLLLLLIIQIILILMTTFITARSRPPHPRRCFGFLACLTISLSSTCIAYRVVCVVCITCCKRVTTISKPTSSVVDENMVLMVAVFSAPFSCFTLLALCMFALMCLYCVVCY